MTLVFLCLPHCCHSPSASLYFPQRWGEVRSTIVPIVESFPLTGHGCLNETVRVPHGVFRIIIFFFKLYFFV